MMHMHISYKIIATVHTKTCWFCCSGHVYVVRVRVCIIYTCVRVLVSCVAIHNTHVACASAGTDNTSESIPGTITLYSFKPPTITHTHAHQYPHLRTDV